MESGAIMIYLADKTGKFLPQQGEPRYRVIEWLMWQMGGIGPMLGQAHHFLHFNKGKAPLRRGALSARGAAALRRPRSPAGGSRIRRRRLLHRRYGDLAVDLAFRVAGDRPRRVSERETLVSARSPADPPCRRVTTCRNSHQTSRCRERIGLARSPSQAAWPARPPLPAGYANLCRRRHPRPLRPAAGR